MYSELDTVPDSLEREATPFLVVLLAIETFQDSLE